MQLKRAAKGLALGLVARTDSPRPDLLSSAALGAMKLGLSQGSAEGYEGGRRAACCVSIDFDVTVPDRFLPNRLGTASLLRLSEKHGVPLTWAICGKTADADREAFESILRSPVRQEVGVHTYSHIYADEVPEAAFEEDIKKCLGVAGMPAAPASFVFPKNRVGHFGLIKRLGFRCYRGPDRAIGMPVEENGLLNIKPVYYVDQKSLGAAGLINRFVDAAIARRGVFHLWTHPWSLAIGGKPDAMEESTMGPVFAHLREKADGGLLSLTTMGDIAALLSPRGAGP